MSIQTIQKNATAGSLRRLEHRSECPVVAEDDFVLLDNCHMRIDDLMIFAHMSPR
jgi:hypothetical protein